MTKRIRTGDGMDAAIGVIAGLGLSVIIWMIILGVWW